MPRPILIIEDEESIREALADLFEVPDAAITAVATLEDAKAALAARPYDLIITDIRLGGKRDGGLQVMAAAGLLSPQATVIALTAFPDQDNRLASLRLGATYFLEKPADLQTIASIAAQHGVASSIYRDAQVPAGPRPSATS